MQVVKQYLIQNLFRINDVLTNSDVNRFSKESLSLLKAQYFVYLSVHIVREVTDSRSLN